jgi:hypothetical protein
MTPETLHLAESIAERLISGLDALPELPGHIVLATYENQLDYETLRPEDQPATVEDHRAMIQHIQLLIEHEYNGMLEVRTTILNASGYLRWLATHQLTNTAENRAAYAAYPKSP